MAGTIPLGRICWHELLTNDTEAAAAYYTKVVGWGILAWDQDPTYRMWTTNGMPIGGLMKLPEEAKAMGALPNWLWYASTPNVDETVAHATRLGAKSLSGMLDVPNVGRMAVMADPQGATFAVYQPSGDTPGHDGKPAMGEISWHELATTDWKAAFDFYHALLGWEKMDVMDSPAGPYLMFGRLGQMLGGVYNKPAGMPAQPLWHCYARVPDAGKAAALATRHGGKVMMGPMEVPGGDMIAMCVDPQGAAFAVHAVAAAGAKPASKPKAPAKPKAAASKKKTAKAAGANRKAAKKKTATKKTATKKTATKKTARKPAAEARSAKRKTGKKKGAKRPAKRAGAKGKKKSAGHRKAAKRSAGRR